MLETAVDTSSILGVLVKIQNWRAFNILALCTESNLRTRAKPILLREQDFKAPSTIGLVAVF
jgi:hypothetical protein